MQTFSLPTFFQIYQNALHDKMLSFEYSCFETPWMHDFCQCLVRESRIAGYRFVKDKLQIFLSHDFMRTKPLNPRFVFYSVNGRKAISSWKALVNFKKQYPISSALIAIPGGILTLDDCLQRRCGGRLLVVMI